MFMELVSIIFMNSVNTKFYYNKISMICENCNLKHEGNYGSGRFCTEKCARGFSTKLKRNEINNKVSEVLKGRISNFKGKKGK